MEPLQGELKKRIHQVFWDERLDGLIYEKICDIVNEMAKELLENSALKNYEEIAVPDAWEPWFKKWIGKAKELD